MADYNQCADKVGQCKGLKKGVSGYHACARKANCKISERKKLEKLKEKIKVSKAKAIIRKVIKKKPAPKPKLEQTIFKFDPSKFTIYDMKNIFGKTFYQIYYKDNNNVYIEGSIASDKPYFYLDEFSSQNVRDKPRAKKGMASFFLCEFLKEILKHKKLKLKPSSDFKLTAGNISDGHNQSKLNKYYESLDFKKDGIANSSGSQEYKQTISSFIKNCKKRSTLKTKNKK